MSLMDRVKASAVETRSVVKKCTTCQMLKAMSADDLAEYHEARALIGHEIDGVKILLTDVARGLSLRPATYREHVAGGHSEPR